MTYKITKCKAVNPSACLYHNAMANAEAAKKAKDFEAYFEARRTIELCDLQDWLSYEVSDPEVDNLPDVPIETVQATVKSMGASRFLEEIRYAPPGTMYSFPTVGKIAIHEEEEGHEDGPSHIWAVITNGKQYWRLTGSYSSWDGSDWYDDVEEVVPSREVSTVVVTKYKVIR